jgi:hypothetical protein
MFRVNEAQLELESPEASHAALRLTILTRTCGYARLGTHRREPNLRHFDLHFHMPEDALTC